VSFDNHDKFLSKAFFKILEIGDPLEDVLPLIIVRIKKRQILHIGQDVTFVYEIVTEFVHKLIQEILR
jgi:hypothetical protein